MKRGVSFYSYQQSQFFRELDLESQIREVGEALPDADGVEIVDEMSLRYPDPGDEFVARWFDWMDRYGTTPVTMDVCMDVLQFRDHVMTYEECADRLRRDIRLAERLGFRNVRVLSVVPLEVMLSALPLAEELDVRLGKEIHQPMPLEGRQVTEIVEHVERTGTRHLGIVPDFGIFGWRPSEVQLAWFERRGASPAATAAAVELAELLRAGKAPVGAVDMSFSTAGNLRVDVKRFLTTGEVDPAFADTFRGVKAFTESRVDDPAEIDHTVVFEALMLSNTSGDTLRELVPHVVSVHGKFNNMSEIPGRPGQYQDIAIDYDTAISALVAGGYDGYVNSEYEGQRYFQDRGRAELADEVEQVRRHQEMLRRLTAA
ncbi:xylose isomerase [Actinomycetospora sp. TBRC 11914]|nr:xylose isomerase [Actinomycetospora sp. TBRC 11914]